MVNYYQSFEAVIENAQKIAASGDPGHCQVECWHLRNCEQIAATRNDSFKGLVNYYLLRYVRLKSMKAKRVFRELTRDELQQLAVTRQEVEANREEILRDGRVARQAWLAMRCNIEDADSDGGRNANGADCQ